MKQTALWSILVATALVAPRAFADDEAAFQHSKELKSSSIKQEELLAVTLDAEVFASTGNGYPDLRLLDGDLRPIPYLLRKVRTIRARTVRETWTGRKPSVRPLADGGLEIIVQVAKKDQRSPIWLEKINGLVLSDIKTAKADAEQPQVIRKNVTD